MLPGQLRSGVGGASHLTKNLRTSFSQLCRSRGLATEVAQSSQQAPQPPSARPGRQQHRVQTHTTAELASMSEPVYSSQIVHGRGAVRALQHPCTHRIPVASLTIRGHTPAALNLFAHFASHAAAALGIPLSRAARLPVRRRLWTVLKGPFAHKKAQENFERRVHGVALRAWDAPSSVVERWVRYLKSHPQPGVGVRVVRWQRAPLGIGKSQEERMSGVMRETVKVENVTVRERVEALAGRIVREEMQAAEAEAVQAQAGKDGVVEVPGAVGGKVKAKVPKAE